MKKLKAGIIGLGRIASLYELDKRAKRYYPFLTHAGTYVRHPGVRLTCGSDVDGYALRKFENMWGVKNLYTDYKRMLRENDIDILSICTPPEGHYRIIRAALGAVKAILCEKPFTNGSGEIRKIIKLNRRYGTPVEVNLYREYDESHARIKDIIKSGRLGAVQRVNSYYGKGLRNMGTHALGYLMGIFGKPQEVKVLGKKRYAGIKEYTYDIYLKFRNGVPALMQGCDFNKFRLFEFDFICEKGRIQILDEGFMVKTFCVKENRAETGAYEAIEKDSSKSSIGRSLYNAIDHLVRICEGKEKKAIMSPERYLDLQMVIEEVEEKGKDL